jgi:hypothetical protein
MGSENKEKADRTKLLVATATIATASAALVTALFGPAACKPTTKASSEAATSSTTIVWRNSDNDPSLIDQTLPERAAGKEIRMSVYASAIRDNKNPAWDNIPSTISLIVKLNGNVKCTSQQQASTTNGPLDINIACNFEAENGLNRVRIEAPNRGSDADRVRATIEYEV